LWCGLIELSCFNFFARPLALGRPQRKSHPKSKRLMAMVMNGLIAGMCP
jgi:hypothetical protein